MAALCYLISADSSTSSYTRREEEMTIAPNRLATSLTRRESHNWCSDQLGFQFLYPPHCRLHIPPRTFSITIHASHFFTTRCR